MCLAQRLHGQKRGEEDGCRGSGPVGRCRRREEQGTARRELDICGMLAELVVGVGGAGLAEERERLAQAGELGGALLAGEQMGFGGRSRWRWIREDAASSSPNWSSVRCAADWASSGGVGLRVQVEESWRLLSCGWDVVACADDVEGAVEVALDGAQGQAGDLGDLGDVHLFEEAKQEDGALAVGEVGDRLPDERRPAAER